MNEQYLNTLTDYLKLECKWFIIILGILLLYAVVKIIISKKKGRKLNIKSSLLFAILVFFVIVLELINIIPVSLDIKENSVESIEYSTAYVSNQDKPNSLWKVPILVEGSNGPMITLQNTSEDFPYATENGTIIYAKHSKIILEYSAKVIHKDHF